MMPLRKAERTQVPSGPDQRNRLIISTECPNCGGPLDFDEGIHAVECHHCRTHFLITGRKRLQTYSVDPCIDASAASRAAQQVLGSGRLPQSELVFVPYYRFAAHDFFWYQPGTVDTAVLLREAAEPVGWKTMFAEPAQKPDGAIPLSWEEPREAKSPASPAATGLLHVTQGLDLKSRLIDRTFMASAIDRPALFSLGIRGSALKLRLLQSNRIKERGTIVAVSVPPQAAVERALKTYERRVAMRATVCQSLAVIYFPYWLARSDNGVTAIIDGVTGGVADRDVPMSIARQLMAGGEAAPATIELRALTCPNCGWDFPVRGDDVAFLCSSCDRAWQLVGSELEPIEAVVADFPAGQTTVYLPFWVISKLMHDGNRNFFVAAFRYKNLRNLHQLASNLTGRQPQYATGGTRQGEMIGCFYDKDDACRLSRFLVVRRPVGPGAQQSEEPAIQRAVLTWIPFGIRGGYLVDPFLGTNLTQNLLG